MSYYLVDNNSFNYLSFYDYYSNFIDHNCFKTDKNVDDYLRNCKLAFKKWDYDISVKKLLNLINCLDYFLNNYRQYRLNSKGLKVDVWDKDARGDLFTTKVRYFDGSNFKFIADFLDFNDLILKAKISRFKNDKINVGNYGIHWSVKKILAIDKQGDMLVCQELDTWDGEEEGFYYSFFVIENKKESSDE